MTPKLAKVCLKSWTRTSSTSAAVLILSYTGDVFDPTLPELRRYTSIPSAAVARDALRLVLDLRVIADVTISEIGHPRLLAGGDSFGGGIFAAADHAEDLKGLTLRLMWVSLP